MKRHTLCVLGGTGFVGRHLINRLVSCGHRVRVPTRHRERNRSLLVLPTLDMMEADVLNVGTLQEALRGCDAVINLVGILNESRRVSFETVHVELPRNLTKLCQDLGIRRLLHTSALNANAQNSPSHYLRSKGEGENVVSQTGGDLAVTIFRPSVIFGPEDHFFNRFAHLLRLSPGVLLLPCPEARFAPVFVGNVVDAYMQALDDKNTYGQHYELCGPRAYTLQALLEYLVRLLGIRRKVIGLSARLSRLAAHVMGHMPSKPFTYDNYLSMQTDAVCRGAYPTAFDTLLEPIEAIVPYYIQRALPQFIPDAYHRPGTPPPNGDIFRSEPCKSTK